MQRQEFRFFVIFKGILLKLISESFMGQRFGFVKLL